MCCCLTDQGEPAAEISHATKTRKNFASSNPELFEQLQRAQMPSQAGQRPASSAYQYQAGLL